MSHLASRLVAEWLRDATHGLDAIAANVPRLADDDALDPVTVYDDLSEDWLAQGQLPSEHAKDDIAYPCALVVNGAGRFSDSTGFATSEGFLTDGTASVVVQLVVRDAESPARGLRTLMYLVRALRSALMAFSDSDAASAAARVDTALGIRLLPGSQPVDAGRSVVPMGDDLLSLALVVSFPVHETAVSP